MASPKTVLVSLSVMGVCVAYLIHREQTYLASIQKQARVEQIVTEMVYNRRASTERINCSTGGKQLRDNVHGKTNLI